MSKKIVVLAVMVSLLLLSSLSNASRPQPRETHQLDFVELKEATQMMGLEDCEGLGEEECLKRRTLVAHVDYIYTRGKHD